MSSAAQPEGTAPFPQPDLQEAEVAHEISDADCRVCRTFRMDYMDEECTTYAELQCTAAEGCELCELLLQVSGEAYIALERLPQDTDVLWMFPDGEYGTITALWEGMEKSKEYKGGVSFYVLKGSGVTRRSSGMNYSLIYPRRQLPMGFQYQESFTRRECRHQ